MRECPPAEKPTEDTGLSVVPATTTVDRKDGLQAMTLQELKDKLATYGVNDQERDAPVFVTINGSRTLPITAGDVDYGSHPDDPAQGTFVLLNADQCRHEVFVTDDGIVPTCDYCNGPQRVEGDDWNGDTGSHYSCEERADPDVGAQIEGLRVGIPATAPR